MKRNLAVLQVRISPENVLAMSEMLAMIATKKLMAYMGKLAENAHVNLCRDVFCKGESGYVLTDSYDLVQSTALFLCEHYGAHLDDLYTTKKKRQARHHQEGMLPSHDPQSLRKVQYGKALPKS